MTGLETFTPLERTVRAGGLDIAIRPLKLGQMAAAAAAAKPLLPFLWVGDYYPILSDLPDEARTLLIHGVGISPEFADQLDGAEVIELLSAWHEVNADFLLQRLAPAGRAAREAARMVLDRMTPKAEPPTGVTSSLGSDSAATALPTAST